MTPAQVIETSVNNNSSHKTDYPQTDDHTISLSATTNVDCGQEAGI